MQGRAAWSALLITTMLAGCLAGDGDANGDQVDYDAIEAAIGEPLAEGNTLDTYNLERLALVNGHEGDAPLTEGYWQTALKGDYAYLTRTGPEAGLVIFDVSDITNPVEVGFIRLHAGFEPDIEISSDENWAFWETQRFPTSAEVPTAPEVGANLQRGVHIIDISDKTAPRWAGFSLTLPDGPHSITYADIDGRHILFQSVYAFAYAYAGVVVPGMQRLVISELVEMPGGLASLEVLAEYRFPPAEGNLGQQPHDVAIQVHPITGETLAYIAYWNQGVVIINVDDPANPTLVGSSNDFGPADYGAIHMARPFQDLIGGRHVTVAEPEIGGAPDTGYLTFYDTTDPTTPTYISSWKIPGNETSAGGSQGPHYFDVLDGRIALAHYQAGFYVIDVHNEENLMDPKTVAFAHVGEAGTAGLPIPFFGGRTDSAFDAWWHPDGQHIVAGQMAGGLAVFRYDGPREMPE